MNTEEVEWRDLASLVDHLDLTACHSVATGRTWATLDDGTVVWADTDAVTLDMTVPGANRLQGARVWAYGEQADRQRAEWLATLPPEQRAAEEKRRAAAVNLPDPPDWLTDAYRERHPY